MEDRHLDHRLPYALIIEPNDGLNHPYLFLENKYSYQRYTSVEIALQHMSQKYPDIVFLSSSFSLSKCVKVLDALKHVSTLSLVPIVFVVDLSQNASLIPGTTWGNKLGIITSISDNHEVNSTLNRVHHA